MRTYKKNEFRCGPCNRVMIRGRYVRWDGRTVMEGKTCMKCVNLMKRFKIKTLQDFHKLIDYFFN